MCLDCDGHHSGGSSFVYEKKMIFVITKIVCTPTGTGTAVTPRNIP